MNYEHGERVKISGNSDRFAHKMGKVTGSNAVYVWVHVDGNATVTMFERGEVIRPTDATYRLGDKYVITNEHSPYTGKIGTVEFSDPYYLHLKFEGMSRNVTVRHDQVRKYEEPSRSLAELAQEELDKLNDETDELTADLEAINRADAQVREAIKMAQERIPQIHEDRKEVRKKIQTAENRRSELEAFLKTAATLP